MFTGRARGALTMSKVACLIAAVLLASCATKAALVSVAPAAWILPLAAQDQDQVCVIVMEYPGRKCTTVGEIRSYVRNVKAD
jgi:uncharacterized lipoprotein YajG